MHLFISNDDGVFSAGLRALVETLRPHHQISVVAPESQRSGGSHSITCVQPIRVRRVTLPGLEDIEAYAVDGTPADCVRLGCSNLGIAADMVLTGINHGGNLGSDVLYSGTVGAAMEGVIMGKPAIAVSCEGDHPSDFSSAARAALWAVDYVRRNPLPPGMLLNLNAPELPVPEIKGIKLTGLRLQNYDNDHAEFTDPFGMRYFWTPAGKTTQCAPDEDTDERWIREGYVTLTPIHFDISNYEYMKKMDVSDFDLTSLAERPQENA